MLTARVGIKTLISTTDMGQTHKLHWHAVWPNYGDTNNTYNVQPLPE